MSLSPTALSPAVGVEVTDLDLSRPLPANDLAQLERTFNHRSMIVFRNQDITEAQGRDFFAHFGPRIDGLGRVSNEAATGRGELKFHAEQSFQRTRPIRGLALYGKTVPASGGATLFINCAAAYRGMPDDLRDRIEQADTVHSYDPAVRLGSDYTAGPGYPTGGWATVHPAVLRHPITDEPILYISPWFTTAIVGLSDEESTDLLTELLEHLARPEFSYRHEWKPDDLVMWDNFTLIHAREPYDESKTRLLWKFEFGLPAKYRLAEPHSKPLDPS